MNQRDISQIIIYAVCLVITVYLLPIGLEQALPNLPSEVTSAIMVAGVVSATLGTCIFFLKFYGVGLSDDVEPSETYTEENEYGVLEEITPELEGPKQYRENPSRYGTCVHCGTSPTNDKSARCTYCGAPLPLLETEQQRMVR